MPAAFAPCSQPLPPGGFALPFVRLRRRLAFRKTYNQRSFLRIVVCVGFGVKVAYPEQPSDWKGLRLCALKGVNSVQKSAPHAKTDPFSQVELQEFQAAWAA